MTEEKNIITLDLEAYNTEDILGDEKSICQDLADNDYSYICDGVSELADSYVPVYTSDLWKNAADLQEYIEDAISEGLTDTRDADLTRTFAAGYYLYYQRTLYDNLARIAGNVLRAYVNDLKLEEGDLWDDLEDKIEELAEDFDHNDNWDDLRERLQEWIDEQIEATKDEEDENEAE